MTSSNPNPSPKGSPAGNASLRARLVDGVRALGSPVGYERSIKLGVGELRADRFLLSAHRSALGPRPAERLLSLCGSAGLPAAAASPVREALADADLVHLGYEGAQAGATAKVYLERAHAARDAIAARRPGPCLVHRAFKWDGAGRVAESRYVCDPALEADDLRALVLEHYGPARASAALATSILDSALAGADRGDVLALTVTEAGSARRSFDLKVYDAAIGIAGWLDRLLALAAEYRIDEAHARRVLTGAAGEVLGHVSGGLDRAGKPFMTLYFGVRELDPREGVWP